MSSNKSYDVAVLGGGPGGYVAAIRAAQLGLSTVVIDKAPKLGGTCLHWGCIPTKALLHFSGFYHQVTQAAEMGVVIGEASLDMGTVQKKKNRVVRKMAMGLDGLMKKNNIQVVTGRGRLAGPNRIDVEGADAVEARHIILATGSTPARLPLAEVDGERVFTSDEILGLETVPESLLVIGAGAVGLEFACVFADFGARVEVVEMLDRPLPLEDEEISGELKKSFERRGIPIHCSTRIDTIAVGERGVTVKAGERSWETQALLLAIGRRPVTGDLGLEVLGIELDGPFVKVDEFCRTTREGVYAIGDIIKTPQLAHVASAEGILAAEHIAGHNPRPLEYDRMPSATYCRPEVASVGLTEAQAAERGYAVKVGRFPWAALGKASILGETEGLVKIVAEERYGELLGVHIVGPHATDLIAEACVALACEATVEELFRTVHAHPTLSEALMEAAHGVFENPIHLPPARRKR